MLAVSDNGCGMDKATMNNIFEPFFTTPEMNGRDLAARLSLCKPAVKTLYMSGYTADVIAHHGVLEQGVHFIQKPFSIQDLAVKVREVIE